MHAKSVHQYPWTHHPGELKGVEVLPQTDCVQNPARGISRRMLKNMAWHSPSACCNLVPVPTQSPERKHENVADPLLAQNFQSAFSEII